MKRILIPALLMGALSVASAGEIDDPVVKKLLEKGIITKQEALELDKKETPTVSISKRLKFGGKAYIGYTFKDLKNGSDSGSFEVRRGYFVTKYYFNEKDHFRFTFDISWQYHKEIESEGKEISLKIKHLYYYKDISNIVPGTGFELGIAHTPWLDYEEHSGWWYRSISKTFYEASDGAHLLPSADAGIDFKTKFEYFSAEYGVFDGEGYDHIGRSDKGNKPNKPMIEGRFTWHILGGGKKKPKPLSQTYANISLHSLNSYNHRGSNYDFSVLQLHAVYNQPLFLLAGQYIKANWDDPNAKDNDGKGYSFNFEVRPFLKNRLVFLGRYDRWNARGESYDRKMYIYGIAYHQNRYITWIINGIKSDYQNDNGKDYTKYMITAELHY